MDDSERDKKMYNNELMNNDDYVEHINQYLPSKELKSQIRKQLTCSVTLLMALPVCQ